MQIIWQICEKMIAADFAIWYNCDLEMKVKVIKIGTNVHNWVISVAQMAEREMLVS